MSLCFENSWQPPCDFLQWYLNCAFVSWLTTHFMQIKSPNIYSDSFYLHRSLWKSRFKRKKPSLFDWIWQLVIINLFKKNYVAINLQWSYKHFWDVSDFPFFLLHQSHKSFFSHFLLRSRLQINWQNYK